MNLRPTHPIKKLIIRIVSSAIIISFFAYDIAWAYPDIRRSGRNLAVTGLQNREALDRIQKKSAERFIDKSLNVFRGSDTPILDLNQYLRDNFGGNYRTLFNPVVSRDRSGIREIRIETDEGTLVRYFNKKNPPKSLPRGYKIKEEDLERKRPVRRSSIRKQVLVRDESYGEQRTGVRGQSVEGEHQSPVTSHQEVHQSPGTSHQKKEQDHRESPTGIDDETGKPANRRTGQPEERRSPTSDETDSSYSEKRLVKRTVIKTKKYAHEVLQRRREYPGSPGGLPSTLEFLQVSPVEFGGDSGLAHFMIDHGIQAPEKPKMPKNAPVLDLNNDPLFDIWMRIYLIPFGKITEKKRIFDHIRHVRENTRKRLTAEQIIEELHPPQRLAAGIREHFRPLGKTKKIDLNTASKAVLLAVVGGAHNVGTALAEEIVQFIVLRRNRRSNPLTVESLREIGVSNFVISRLKEILTPEGEPPVGAYGRVKRTFDTIEDIVDELSLRLNSPFLTMMYLWPNSPFALTMTEEGAGRDYFLYKAAMKAEEELSKETGEPVQLLQKVSSSDPLPAWFEPLSIHTSTDSEIRETLNKIPFIGAQRTEDIIGIRSQLRQSVPRSDVEKD
ncbi:MAG: hypothetical protein ABIJ27_00825, partial [Candidatus Omnitrophota bacterium]